MTIFARPPAACPLAFISAFLAAIGSYWLETAVVPKATIATAAKAEIIFIQSSLQAFPVSGKHQLLGLIPAPIDARRGD